MRRVCSVVFLVCLLLTGCSEPSAVTSDASPTLFITPKTVLDTPNASAVPAAVSATPNPTTPKRTSAVIHDDYYVITLIDDNSRAVLEGAAFREMLPWNYTVYAATMGDLNGDGVDDIVLCAFDIPNGETGRDRSTASYLTIVAWGSTDGSYRQAASSSALNVNSASHVGVLSGIVISDGWFEIRRDQHAASGLGVHKVSPPYASAVRFAYDLGDDAFYLTREETNTPVSGVPFYYETRIQTPEHFGKIRFEEYDNLNGVERAERILKYDGAPDITAITPIITFTDKDVERHVNAIMDEHLDFMALSMRASGVTDNARLQCYVTYQDEETLSLYFGAFDVSDGAEHLRIRYTVNLSAETAWGELTLDDYTPQELTGALSAFQKAYPQFNADLIGYDTYKQDELLLALGQTDKRSYPNGAFFTFTYRDDMAKEPMLAVLAPVKNREVLMREAAERTVYVTNAREFLAAIAPNRRIVLREGVYDVTDELLNGDRYKSGYVISGSDGELELRGLWNTTIEGEGAVSIVTREDHANVMYFVGCEGITIKNITAGHEVQPGYCTGGVIVFTNGRDLFIDSCTLYGCGINGLSVGGAYGVRVHNTVITDCSDAAVYVSDGSDAVFTDCVIKENGYYSALIMGYHARDVHFERCRIIDNRMYEEISWYRREDAMLGTFARPMGSRMTFTDCTITGNALNMPDASDAMVRFENCVVENNALRPTPTPSPKPASTPEKPTPSPIDIPISLIAGSSYDTFEREVYENDMGIFSDMDLDGDGKNDTLEVRRDDYNISFTLTLGSGAIYTEDMECTFFERFDIADLTGDGKLELIIMGDTGGVGGAGCHNIIVLSTDKKGRIIKLPIPARSDESLWDTGYDFTVVYKDHFLMDIYCGALLVEDVPIPEDRRQWMREWYYYDYKERINQQITGWTDGFCDFIIVPYENGYALEMRQYVCGEGHSDGIGMGVSVIRWDGKVFEAVRHSFEVFF